VRVRSCAEEPCIEEGDLGSAIHLTLDHLELGDLAFGLTIGSGFGDGGPDGKLVFVDTAGEGCDQRLSCCSDPVFQFGGAAVADQFLELLNEASRRRKRWHTGFDRGDSDRIGPTEMVAREGHHPRDSPGGWDFAQGLGRDLLGTPPTCRPFTKDPERASKALGPETALEFRAVAASCFPLFIEELAAPACDYDRFGA